VETVVALLIASVMLVAALNSVGAARATAYKVEERNRGLGLAQALMAEVLQQAYADPAYGPGSMGVGADEVTGNRSLFDDVDDYDGWQASPPQRKDGSVITSATGYEEVVHVTWVNPGIMFQQSASETGVKRIEVSINHQNRTVATLVAYRTQAWTDPTTAQGVVP
jgi:type II secretory pathway pseudopilin PulG